MQIERIECDGIGVRLKLFLRFSDIGEGEWKYRPVDRGGFKGFSSIVAWFEAFGMGFATPDGSNSPSLESFRSHLHIPAAYCAHPCFKLLTLGQFVRNLVGVVGSTVLPIVSFWLCVSSRLED